LGAVATMKDKKRDCTYLLDRWVLLLFNRFYMQQGIAELMITNDPSKRLQFAEHSRGVT